MRNISKFIVSSHKKIVVFFIFSVLISGFLSRGVVINYKLIDYLPKEAPSTLAINVMMDEFGTRLPNGRIMVSEENIVEILSLKEKLSDIEGMLSVTWLDDVLGEESLKTTPLAFMNQNMVNMYYKDGQALFSIIIESGYEQSVMKEVYTLIGPKNAAAGDAVSTAETQSMSVSEVSKAMAILIPVIILILLLSTMSWIEPLFFLITIGVAIILNMGTNIVFDNISFITRTVSPVLQLAVSLDYAIFLLHSFNEYREKHNPEKAMQMAIEKSLPTISASAATTLVGFAALIFMRFGIGADLGINLLKGIVFSFVSVIFFLPSITLLAYRLIDKTSHRDFLPKLDSITKILLKLRVPFMIIALLVMIPAYLAQAQTEFSYGVSSVTQSSRAGLDNLKIEAVYGKENALVLMVPKENVGKELELITEIENLENVKNVLAYANMVGTEVPKGLVSQSIIDQFYSEHTSRIVVYLKTQDEGEIAFNLVDEIERISYLYYDEVYISGTTATLRDMRNVVVSDTQLVNMIAIFGIFLILLVTFKSLTLPVLLIFTIETAIWINLSFPYFSSSKISFIGYLILSTVQLGATVDYAILITDGYKHHRKKNSAKQAIEKTLNKNLISVLVSGSILSLAGFILDFASTNPIIKELGTLLGRGTLLSMSMVALVLPALLVLFDQWITKQKDLKQEDVI